MLLRGAEASDVAAISAACCRWGIMYHRRSGIRGVHRASAKVSSLPKQEPLSSRKKPQRTQSWL
jgi:hypothetical protein